MKTTIKAKKFDCVEMKRKCQSKVRSKLKGMTREQELAYWQGRDQELKAEQEQLRRERRKTR